MKKILLCLAFLISGATGAATLSPVQLLNPAGSTSGQAIVSTGPSTAPAWSNVTATTLAPQAANTVMANATGATASPTAFAMPSCSGANQALRWTSSSGFTCASSIALTTGTLAQFAATTSAQLLGVVSDETGSGVLVFGTSPTLGTPTINTPTISGGTINNATVGIATPLAGKFTTLQTTGAYTPSSTAGIVGTTTNDNASAGSDGEFQCAQVTNGVVPNPQGCTVNVGTPISLTTGTAANVTSLSLTAGDYDVWGTVGFLPAGGTTSTFQLGWISTSSATPPTYNSGAVAQLSGITGAAGTASNSFSVGQIRVPLASTTTVFLEVLSTFSGSTETAYGFLAARRRR